MENMCVISKTDAKLSESDMVLDYMSIYREGYVVPIVDLSCQFKQPLSFGEEAIVETRFIHSDDAKILLNTPSTGHRTKTLWQQEPHTGIPEYK